MNKSNSGLLIYFTCFTLLTLFLQFNPSADLFYWSRDAILNGEIWRLISGHFIHTNLWHLAMNLLALYLICWIFRRYIRIKQLTYLLIYLALSISLLLFTTQLDTYVGLSGVLHGLFGYFCLCEITAGRRSTWILLFGLIAKIIHEQIQGPNHLTQDLIQAPVAIQAHLFGAVVAFIGFGIVFAYQKKISLS